MNVLMPQLGETVAEGKITKWFKSAGDAVKPGDNLFEIETDKVSMEVPSTSAGVLSEIRVGVGEVAPVGAIVAVIAGEGGAPAAAPAAATPPKQEIATAARTSPSPTAAATRSADQARPVLRGAHARPQLWPGEASRRRRRDAAGASARGRCRHRSHARDAALARMAGSWRAMSSPRRASPPHMPDARWCRPRAPAR